MDEKAYIKAFNRGYLLQKHHPNLAKKLGKSLNKSKQSPHLGFIDGANEYRLSEKKRTIEKSNLPKIEGKQQREKSTGRSPSRDRE